MRKIEIFDTTLRDGEQAAKIALSQIEKYAIAQSLANLGVDTIEAGFPISSDGDFQAVESIARNIRGPSIAALARIVKADIDAAWRAIQYSENPTMHIFASTSPYHMQIKLKMPPKEVHRRSVEMTKYTKQLMNGRGTLEFSCEDATRSNREFIAEIIRDVITEGASVINIPDTVGYSTPDEFRALITYLLQNVRGIENAKLSVHCHDDLGLAVANSMAGILAGASQIEVAVNGIGERAGNASLEEVVAGLKTRGDFYGAYTNVNTKLINYLSKQVSRLMGMPVQPNKAIVGENAFAHRAGIHQDGVIKGTITYEIMDPRDYGWKEESMIITPRSGKNAIRQLLIGLGYKITDDELQQTYKLAMTLADKKRTLSPEDLIAILENEVRKAPETIKLTDFHVTTGMSLVPTAAVKLSYDGNEVSQSSIGDGPIDALYRAINSALGIQTDIARYNINAVTEGKEAQGEVTVVMKYNGKQLIGRGVSTDIIEASVKAYVNAVNKMMHQKTT